MNFVSQKEWKELEFLLGKFGIGYTIKHDNRDSKVIIKIINIDPIKTTLRFEEDDNVEA